MMIWMKCGDEVLLTTQVDCSNQGMCRRSSRKEEKKNLMEGLCFVTPAP